MLSTMSEQELAGVTLMSVHFCQAMQPDAYHVRRGFLQKTAKNCAQLFYSNDR